MWESMTCVDYFRIFYPETLQKIENRNKKTRKNIITELIIFLKALKIDMNNRQVEFIDYEFLRKKISAIKNKEKKRNLSFFEAACQITKKTNIHKDDIDEAIEYLEIIKNIA